MDVIRWPYRTTMRMRLADGSYDDVQVQWFFSSNAAKPLPFPHSYGSSNYYDPQGFNKDGPGELVEGRIRNRKSFTPPPFASPPCPNDPAAWNGFPDLE